MFNCFFISLLLLSQDCFSTEQAFCFIIPLFLFLLTVIILCSASLNFDLRGDLVVFFYYILHNLSCWGNILGIPANTRFSSQLVLAQLQE